jgi:plasmid stabilization system protein ParE
LTIAYRLNRHARAELDDAPDEYESQQAGLGSRFAASIEAAIQQVGAFPESAPRVRGDIRRKVVTDFPYSILYRVRHAHIRILAIAHQHRQPFYWLRRG